MLGQHQLEVAPEADGEPWFDKSLKLSTSILRNYPTYERYGQAEAQAIDALTWLGRYEDALAMSPEDDHVRADLLWALGRFDEACAIHAEDDPTVDPPLVLVELQAARASLHLGIWEQIAWLKGNPDNPHSTVLRDAWMAADQRNGLVAWFTLFPLDDAQQSLTPAQLRDIAGHPDVHIEMPPDPKCAPYSAAAEACLQGDPALAEPLVGSQGLSACLDVEVWLRSQPDGACLAATVSVPTPATPPD